MEPTRKSTLNITSENQAAHLFEFGYDDGPLWSQPGVMVPLKCLTHSQGFREVWFDGEEVKTVSIDADKQWHQTQQHGLFVTRCAAEKTDVRAIYLQAYEIARTQGFRHLLRTWNYLHDIHKDEPDLERYQVFCVERHEALEQLHVLNSPNPAATAIGGHLGDDCFVFLFAQKAGQVIENKRQVSAWDYPIHYAPKQPRFSRAMWVDGLLMCSGTASVVGHATQHENDLTAQFGECLNNVQVLLHDSPLDVGLNSGLYRFYLRNKADLDELMNLIKAQGITDYVVLEGDVCRRNLLLECEVVFQ